MPGAVVSDPPEQATEVRDARGGAEEPEPIEIYRDLYEEAPNAYVSLGQGREFLNVNRRAIQLLGYPAEELVGSSSESGLMLEPIHLHFAFAFALVEATDQSP